MRFGCVCWKCFCPCTIGFSVQHRKPRVIAKEGGLRSLEGAVGPSVVQECLCAVRGPSEGKSRAAIVGIVAAVIKLNVDISVGRIYCRPLKELVNSVVEGI